MIKVRGERDQVNVAKVWEAGQSHVFRFWDTLNEGQRRALLDQIDGLDWQLLGELLNHVDRQPSRRRLEPPDDVIRLPGPGQPEPPERAAAREAGQAAIAAGKVAGLLVAGGQGSRLGFDRPKGCFPIGPVTDRSLLQVFFEQARAVADRYRTSFPLYVMTSAQNHETLRAFLDEHDRFGLSPVDVTLFRQRELPVVDRRGRLLLAEPWRIATSPDGHGGVLRALVASGALEHMRRRGIEVISYWQVDNPLVPIADPVMLGYLLVRGDEAAAKVALKRSPEEKVGVWARIDGTLGVVEYSELRPEDAEARDDRGELRYGWANLAIHAFRRSFFERLADGLRLPYHVARKRVPYVDREGRSCEPEQPNGIKFETFIFDAFAQARGVTLLEVDRAREFAPVKNAAGQDSPATARQALCNQYGAWLEQLGARVAREADGDVRPRIEISPLTALGPEDLEGRIEPGTEIPDPFVL